MTAMLEAMTQADESYQEGDRSHSGLVGGDGGKMAAYGQGSEMGWSHSMTMTALPPRPPRLSWRVATLSP